MLSIKKRRQPRIGAATQPPALWAFLLLGTLLMAAPANAAAPAATTITTQDQWNTAVGPATVGDFIINSATDITTHAGNPALPLSITGMGVGSTLAVYGTGALNVNGQLTLHSVNEGIRIGSEGLTTAQNGTVNVQRGGFLNIIGEIHLGGEANAANLPGGKGTLLVDGGKMHISQDLSIGGEAEGASGGDGSLTVQNGGTVIVANNTRLGGEVNTGVLGGQGDILVTGGYFGTTLFTASPNTLLAGAPITSLNVLGTGITTETRAIARLGNQYLDWVYTRKPVAEAFTSIMAVGNAVTPPSAEGLNLRWTSWSVGGAVANDHTFGANSLAIINTKGLVSTNSPGILYSSLNNNTPVFQIGSTLVLAMDGVKAGQKLIAVKDFDNGNAMTGQWSHYYTTSRLVEHGTPVATGNDISMPIRLRNLDQTLPGTSAEAKSLLAAMATQIGVDTSMDPAASQGQRFFSRATDYRYVENRGDTATIVESALNTAAGAGVQGSTLAASHAASTASQTRLTGMGVGQKGSGASVRPDGTVEQGISGGDSYANGLALWIMPLFQANTVNGMKVGDYNSGYTSNLLGISVGADYTINDSVRLGLAFNMGGMYTQSNGDFKEITNRGDFVGGSLYGGWNIGNLTLSADLGYTSVFNDVEQNVPGTLQLGNNTADIHSSALTAGIRADYRFVTQSLDIVPHVGLRYTGLRTEDFQLENSGSAILETEGAWQNIWTIPVGVTLEKGFTTASGWTIKPQVDLGVIAAAGDLQARASSKIPGVTHTAETDAQVVDAWTFDGTAGLELSKGAFSFNVNYNFQGSEHRTGHGVFGMFKYEF